VARLYRAIFGVGFPFFEKGVHVSADGNLFIVEIKGINGPEISVHRGNGFESRALVALVHSSGSTKEFHDTHFVAKTDTIGTCILVRKAKRKHSSAESLRFINEVRNDPGLAIDRHKVGETKSVKLQFRRLQSNILAGHISLTAS
jgi:hypothetical protein